jgi:hypothetical protein
MNFNKLIKKQKRFNSLKITGFMLKKFHSIKKPFNEITFFCLNYLQTSTNSSHRSFSKYKQFVSKKLQHLLNKMYLGRIILFGQHVYFLYIFFSIIHTVFLMLCSL